MPLNVAMPGEDIIFEGKCSAAMQGRFENLRQPIKWVLACSQKSDFLELTGQVPRSFHNNAEHGLVRYGRATCLFQIVKQPGNSRIIASRGHVFLQSFLQGRLRVLSDILYTAG